MSDLGASVVLVASVGLGVTSELVPFLAFPSSGLIVLVFSAGLVSVAAFGVSSSLGLGISFFSSSLFWVLLSSVGLGASLEGVGGFVGMAVSFVGTAVAALSGSVFGAACSLLGAGWASVAVCAGWAASVAFSVLDSTVFCGLLAAAGKYKKKMFR